MALYDPSAGAGPRTAFDYFLQGQQARQQHQTNNQMMEARAQEMQQAQQMNPLLLQAQRAGINLTQAQTQGVVGSEQRAQEMNPLQQQLLQAQTGAQEASTQYSNFQTERGQTLLPGEVEANQANIAQSKAATNASNQSAAQARAAVEEQRRLAKQQKEQEQIEWGGNIAERYLKAKEADPEMAEMMLPGIQKAYKAKFGEKLPKEMLQPENLLKVIEAKNMQGQMSPASVEQQKQNLAQQKFEYEKSGQKDQRANTAEAKNAFAAANSAIATVDSLLAFGDDTLNNVAGSLDALFPTFGQKAVDFEEELKQLESQLTMANLDKMVGVLSDTDIKVLRQAAGNLSLKQSAPRLKGRIETIKKVLNENKAIIAEKFGVSENGPAITPEGQAALQKYGYK